MKNKRHKYEDQVAPDKDSGSTRVVQIVGENKRVLEIAKKVLESK